MLIGSSGPCGQAILENTDPHTQKTGLSPNAESHEWNLEDLKLLTGSLLDTVETPDLLGDPLWPRFNA